MRTSNGLLVLGAIVLTLAGCKRGSPPAPIYLGHVATVSGPGKEAGEQASRGIRLAILEHDKDTGQALSRPVAVRHTDTKGKLEAFEAEAVRLVGVSKVVALYGGTTPEEITRLDRSRVPVVSPAGLSTAAMSENVFLLGLSPSYQGQLLARFAAEELVDVTRVAVLADESREEAVLLANAFAQVFPAARAKKDPKGKKASVTTARYGKEATLAKLADDLAMQKPDAVLIAGSRADLHQLRRDLGDFRPPLLFGGEEVGVRAFQDQADPGKIYLVTAFVSDSDVARGKEFVKKYRESFSTEPDVHAALAYDGTRLLIEALRRTKDTFTPERIKEELAGIKDFAGLTGPLSFAADRRVRRDAFVIVVEAGWAKTLKRYGPEE
jgi:branched-chain amino acid transport system substrate-binding protein